MWTPIFGLILFQFTTQIMSIEWMTQEKHYSCTKDASKVAHTIYIILENIACTVTPNGLCTKANVCYYSSPLKRMMDIVYENTMSKMTQTSPL